MDVRDQVGIDTLMIELDGTENKSNWGQCHSRRFPGLCEGCCRGSESSSVPVHRRSQCEQLPVPMMNILNGGKHADNNVDIQNS